MTEPIDLLAMLSKFETTANAGPDREIFQAFLKNVFADGSGVLRVEVSSTQVRCADERLLNRLFTTDYEFRFDNLTQFADLIANLDLVNKPHVEHNG